VRIPELKTPAIYVGDRFVQLSPRNKWVLAQYSLARAGKIITSVVQTRPGVIHNFCCVDKSWGNS